MISNMHEISQGNPSYKDFVAKGKRVLCKDKKRIRRSSKGETTHKFGVTGFLDFVWRSDSIWQMILIFNYFAKEFFEPCDKIFKSSFPFAL